MTVSLAIRPSDFDAAAPAPTLLERLASGDGQAIDEVYRTHHAAVRAFANRFLGDPTAAEDLVHDVFVVLLTNRVNPTRANNKITAVRQAVADSVMAALPPAPSSAMRPRAPR